MNKPKSIKTGVKLHLNFAMYGNENKMKYL